MPKIENKIEDQDFSIKLHVNSEELSRIIIECITEKLFKDDLYGRTEQSIFRNELKKATREVIYKEKDRIAEMAASYASHEIKRVAAKKAVEKIFSEDDE